jgi:hypothetical protein
VHQAPGGDEIATPHRTDNLLPQQTDAITRYDAKFEMRLILKNRRRSGDHNICKQDILRVQSHRLGDSVSNKHACSLSNAVVGRSSHQVGGMPVEILDLEIEPEHVCQFKEFTNSRHLKNNLTRLAPERSGEHLMRGTRLS